MRRFIENKQTAIALQSKAYWEEEEPITEKHQIEKQWECEIINFINKEQGKSQDSGILGIRRDEIRGYEKRAEEEYWGESENNVTVGKSQY